MTGIPGSDAAAGLKAFLSAKKSVGLDRAIRMALDDESVLREHAYGLESRSDECRHHCVQVLIQISQEEPSRLQGEWRGVFPLVVPVLGERACVDAPIQPLKPIGAVRAAGDGGAAQGYSQAQHNGWR